MTSVLRSPDDSQRLSIMGKTGSGKTVAAAWHLSRRSFDTKPWVIFDFKGDGLIGDIEDTGAKEIDLSSPPKKPGLYVVRPRPDQTEEVERFLWQVWKQEKTGLYFDEGYMIGNRCAPFNAILTQGRSKEIPMITLAQRPAWLSRFVFSEADFFQIFWLNDFRDRKTVQSFIPASLENRLADYNSLWYDVSRDQVVVLSPVPETTVILDTFHDRLAPKKRFL